MKDLKIKDIAVVFVGCGGTYWTSQNYFASLLKSIQPKRTFFVDPDILTKANTERQWCESDAMVGYHKCDTASKNMVSILDYVSSRDPLFFADWANDPDIQEEIEDMQVLVIVNVDNDKARLDIRDWCLDHPRRAIMVMSGCDLNYGQVYYGVYDRNQPIHDWFPLHLDVDPNRATPALQTTRTGCGAQSTLSNYLTGALFAPAMEEAVKWFDHSFCPPTISEWYWSRGNEEGGIRLLRMWTQRAAVWSGTEVTNG